MYKFKQMSIEVATLSDCKFWWYIIAKQFFSSELSFRQCLNMRRQQRFLCSDEEIDRPELLSLVQLHNAQFQYIVTLTQKWFTDLLFCKDVLRLSSLVILLLNIAGPCGYMFGLIWSISARFAHTNPLHLDVFQSVVHYEAEVVAMTAALLGSKEKASGGQVCGSMTSGGTESILLVVKSSRDYMRTKKGIKKPEMIIPVSAHSAYDKASQYFNIKLWRLLVISELQADVKANMRYINKNTIMELGQLATSFGVCFHVDLCLGGFVLPFARKLGYWLVSNSTLYFSVQGVTSMFVDVHKYGLSPKGTVVQFSTEIMKIRKCLVSDIVELVPLSE
ncbi:sphingosine-1-phosphate lyase-like [Spinacia oleracea]|uniref:Sphingosine-1-phosphate lyase-like n=1 Tax=Spinacia oleracea TaxID=3562 RepID=A0ABM3RHB8_SPIOL|nr:sphingosine-1-phosphate lyase-like [Spinacia oleracea]